MKKITVFIILLLLLSGCKTIREYERIDKQQTNQYVSYIGGRIFKINKTADLPNALGKADIFGGKVDKGQIDLKFYGYDSNGNLLLSVTYIDFTSTETTMSRYGQTNVSGTTRYHGNTAYTNLRFYDPPEGKTEMLPPNTFLFSLDLSES
jgi:uncharacterized protein YceK